ncbi:MAG: ImmA/IrrE family metallo-endopeptidase [Burkholderiales bacterium]|nr:ImmA/IrrE family metallo-endopeptidase [Burkholderiales bacterium]
MSAPSFAERLLQDYGVDRPEDIDLEAIAYDKGALVKYRPLNGCEARIVGLGDSAIITIDPEAIKERKRFSLAHEIGHWMQDRGTQAHACKKSDIGPQRSAGNTRESEANRFASQLLMPDYLFKPLCAKKPLTFVTAAELAKRFRTSLTATAIKLVQTGNSPGMVVCYRNRKFDWMTPGPDVPKALQRTWPMLDEHTQAHELFAGILSGDATRPQLIDADCWIDEDNAADYTLTEHAIMVAADTVVTLLWWHDESQIRDCDDRHTS